MVNAGDKSRYMAGYKETDECDSNGLWREM